MSDAALPPLPVPDEVSAPFWEACRRRELVMQRCTGCRRFHYPPRIMCPGCQSTDFEWAPVSGRGTIYSFVVCHPPVLPAFAARAPYAVVLVELADDPGLRMVGNLLGCPPDAIEIGMPVEATFQDVSDELALPQWRPARAGPPESTTSRNGERHQSE